MDATDRRAALHALERAREFVREQGGVDGRRHLSVLLGEPGHWEEAVWAIVQSQQGDGGWAPFWAPESGIDATCFRLAQLDQLGVGAQHRAVQRARAFLWERQAPEGAWEEDERFQASAPAWCRPGDEAARLYLTANAAFSLKRIHAPDPAVARAARYLAVHVDGSGRMPSFLHAHWLTAAVLTPEEPVERLMAYLRSCLGRLDGGTLAWLMTSLMAGGVAASHPLIADASRGLVASQAPDGRWTSEDGPERDVQATLEAIRALLWQRDGGPPQP
jgi:hypothetical protein